MINNHEKIKLWIRNACLCNLGVVSPQSSRARVRIPPPVFIHNIYSFSLWKNHFSTRFLIVIYYSASGLPFSRREYLLLFNSSNKVFRIFLDRMLNSDSCLRVGSMIVRCGLTITSHDHPKKLVASSQVTNILCTALV